MKRTVLMLLIGAMVVGLVAPGAASARGNDIDQDADAWAGGGELIENEADVDFDDAYDFAFAAANCQLNVLADAWVTAIASADNLAVITDEDDVEVSGVGGPGRPMGDLAAETAQADCTESVGPVDITVLTAAGFGEESPQGSAADVLTALKFNFGNGRNDVDQDVESGAELDDAIENEYGLDVHDVAHGAVAASNCQAIVGAHIGVLVAAVGSNTGEIEDSDSLSFTEMDEAGASRVDYTQELTVENDHNATSSCSQPIESITIFVGPAGSSRVPSES